MLNIEGRPSDLPNNSRQPPVVLGGDEGFQTATLQHYITKVSSHDLVLKSSVLYIHTLGFSFAGEFHPKNPNQTRTQFKAL